MANLRNISASTEQNYSLIQLLSINIYYLSAVLRCALFKEFFSGYITTLVLLSNAMYPSPHVVHLTSQSNLNEGQHFTGSSVDLLNMMNAEFAQRKNFLFPAQSAINFSHNGSTKHITPFPHNGKTFYNTSKRENWMLRNQSKSKRPNHVASAPCIPTALSEESIEDGKTKTLNPLSNTFSGNNFKDDSSDKSSHSSDSNVVLRSNENQNQKHNMHSNSRNQQRNDRRSEVPAYTKRRINYPRNPPFTFRNRRLSNLMMNIPSPFPPNSLISPYCTAPDRFLLRSYLMEVKHIPEELTNGSIWDQLSQSIWKKFILNQQTEETYRRKMALWKYLFVYIKRKIDSWEEYNNREIKLIKTFHENINQSYYPKYGLYLVGSTMNGFGIECSDVDMCLLIRHAEVDQRSEAISYLTDIYKLLEHCEFVEKLKLIQAKVPLLKFRDCKQGLQVDLNCNNSVGIRNTHLLYCYGQLDWRVKPLIIIVKLWAQWHNINDAKNMTISSYSLALMVLHFLQCGVSPKVLPCLHSLYKDKFSSTSDIGTIDIHEELEPYASKNKQSLGELLLQFFQYYAAFDFMQYAISVRSASTVPIEECRNVRSIKNDPHHWKFLCIEEPFDLTNTAKSVYNPEKFEQIRSIITATAHTLMQTKNVESIFKLNGTTG